MLVFSTGIILFASLFTSPEARFLLCSPARADHIFATKFQAAVAYSSWGFVILGIPIFLAFGVMTGVPWYFYALLPASCLGYVLLPGSVVGDRLSGARALHAAQPPAVLLARRATSWRCSRRIWLYRVGLGIRKSFATSGRELHDLIGQFDLLRSSIAPEPLDDARGHGRGARRLVRGAGAARAGVEQRARALRARGVDREAHLPHRLRPVRRRRPREEDLPDELARPRDGRARLLPRQADPRAGREGLSHLPPRPDAVGPAHHLRPADAARGEQLPAVLLRRVPGDGPVRHQPDEPVRHRDPALRGAEPVRVPAHQPRGAEVLDSRASRR